MVLLSVNDNGVFRDEEIVVYTPDDLVGASRADLSAKLFEVFPKRRGRIWADVLPLDIQGKLDSSKYRSQDRVQGKKGDASM